MKHIIAALEAKGAAARATLVIVLVVAMLSGEPISALAQAGLWQGPNNLYTVDPAGWVYHEEHQPPMVARFTLADAPPGPPQIQCFVAHRLYWDSPYTRAQANAEISRRTPPSNATHAISNITEETLNHVRVVSYQDQFGNVLVRFRMFLTRSRRGEDYNEISCGGSQPLSMAQLASADAFLSSLHINAETAP